MKILVDTSVLIDVLRKRDKQRELLASLVAAHHTPVTTVLNIAELYAGMRPSERTITRRSFGWLTVPWYHRARCAEGKRAQAHIWAKRGRTLGLTDALIAAVAIEEECALLTEKNFPMPELHLYPPARVAYQHRQTGSAKCQARNTKRAAALATAALRLLNIALCANRYRSVRICPPSGLEPEGSLSYLSLANWQARESCPSR